MFHYLDGGDGSTVTYLKLTQWLFSSLVTSDSLRLLFLTLKEVKYCWNSASVHRCWIETWRQEFLVKQERVALVAFPGKEGHDEPVTSRLWPTIVFQEQAVSTSLFPVWGSPYSSPSCILMIMLLSSKCLNHLPHFSNLKFLSVVSYRFPYSWTIFYFSNPNFNTSCFL